MATGERVTSAESGERAGRGRAVALLGTVQVTLIFTITLIAVPLPAIGRELRLGNSELVVVSAAYGLSFSGLLLFGGRLADRYGGRAVFAAGLAVFAAASAITPAAQGFAVLAAGRFGQGVGAALVAPAAMVVLRALFPEPDGYGRAMATWGGLSVLGATAGIVLSGVVATWVSWRWMFVVPLLVAGAGLLRARRLPAARPRDGRGTLDLPGAVLATSGVTLLSYGLVRIDDHAWSSATVGVPLACGVALLAAFGAVEARARDPLLPPSFIADRRRLVALAAIGLSAAATTVVCLFLAFYLQQIRSWSALRTSLAFVPYALVLIVMGRAAGRLVARFGAVAVVVAGLVLAACGLFALAALDPGSSYAIGLLPGLLAMPAGVAPAFAGAAVLCVQGVQPPRIGLAGGVMNTAMELGPTVGLALVSAVASARTHHLTATAPLGADVTDATTSGYAWGFGATGLALTLATVLICGQARKQ
ncbi:MAG TPA: MFS transporter [Streptosporangiaceae bacterium]|nr:MFS transporter [Streptosporangiaceae bacterium]